MAGCRTIKLGIYWSQVGLLELSSKMRIENVPLYWHHWKEQSPGLEILGECLKQHAQTNHESTHNNLILLKQIGFIILGKFFTELLIGRGFFGNSLENQSCLVEIYLVEFRHDNKLHASAWRIRHLPGCQVPPFPILEKT